MSNEAQCGNKLVNRKNLRALFREQIIQPKQEEDGLTDSPISMIATHEISNSLGVEEVIEENKDVVVEERKDIGEINTG